MIHPLRFGNFSRDTLSPRQNGPTTIVQRTPQIHVASYTHIPLNSLENWKFSPQPAISSDKGSPHTGQTLHSTTSSKLNTLLTKTKVVNESAPPLPFEYSPLINQDDQNSPTNQQLRAIHFALNQLEENNFNYISPLEFIEDSVGNMYKHLQPQTDRVNCLLSLVESLGYKDKIVGLEERLESIVDCVKAIEPICNILLVSSKIIFNLNANKRKLNAIKEQYKVALTNPKFENYQDQINRLDQEIDQQKRKAWDKLQKNIPTLFKVLICEVMPLGIMYIMKQDYSTKFQKYAQILFRDHLDADSIRKLVKRLFKVFKEGINAFNCLKYLRLQKTWLNDLEAGPSKQFSSLISEKQHTQIDALLKKRQKVFLQNVKKSEPKIELLLVDCQDKKFEQINSLLKKHGIFLERLKPSVQSIEQWNEKILDSAFKLDLCRQWVDGQETKAILVRNKTQQLLKDKIQQERPLLWIYFFQYSASLALKILDISTYLPVLEETLQKFPTFSYAIEFINKELINDSRPVAKLVHFIQPDTKWLHGQLAISAIGYFFARQYKPHSYSPKAYQLEFNIRFTFAIFALKHLVYSNQRLYLWFQSQIVYKYCIKNLNKALEKQNQFTEISREVEENRRRWKTKVMNLENEIQKLQLLDFQTARNSKTQIAKPGINLLCKVSTLLKDNDLLTKSEEKKVKKYLKKPNNFSNLKFTSLTSSLLQKARTEDLINSETYQRKQQKVELNGRIPNDTSMQPQVNFFKDYAAEIASLDTKFLSNDSRNFFKVNMGINLDQADEKILQQQVEEFFANDAETLMKNYHKRRKAMLQAAR